MKKKSNRTTEAVIAVCKDGAFRRVATLDQLGVDWAPPEGTKGMPGGVMMQGRWILGTYDAETKRFAAA